MKVMGEPMSVCFSRREFVVFKAEFFYILEDALGKAHKFNCVDERK